MNSKASTRFLSCTMYTFSSETFRKQSLGRRANSIAAVHWSLWELICLCKSSINGASPRFPLSPAFVSRRAFHSRRSLARRERNVNHPNTVVNANDLARRTDSTLRLFLILRLRAGALSHDFFQRTREKHTFRSARPFPVFFPPAYARATAFTSNGSTFFTSKRVFHTHVTESAKTDWKCARGCARFPSIVVGDRDKG